MVQLPKDTTLGVQPLDSNQITVTDALKRKQVVRVDRITYDAMGNVKVIYRDSRGVQHKAPIEGYQGLRPSLESLYSKSVDIQDELGQVQTVRLERLFRDSTGALKAQVTGPTGVTKTVDAAQIVGTIPEALVPPPPTPVTPESPPTKEPPAIAPPVPPPNKPAVSPGPSKIAPPPPEQ